MVEVTLHRHRAGLWSLSELPLEIWKASTGATWELADAPQSEPVRDWLRRHRLWGAQFPTKNEALRCVLAHHAADPVPAGPQPLARLRRLADSSLTDPSGRFRVTRVPGGWHLQDRDRPESDPGLHASTLHEARQWIARSATR